MDISAIKKSLRIGTPDCKITKGCILEGELVVYSDFVSELILFMGDSLTGSRNTKFSRFIKSGNMSQDEGGL